MPDRAGIIFVTSCQAVRHAKNRTIMKHLLYFAASLMLTCGLWACDDSDETPSYPTIRVLPADGLTFEAAGGTLSLTVDAQGAEWTVQKSAAWINLAPLTDANRIDITVGPYDATQERSGEIKVLGGAEPVVVKVVQKGVAPVLEVDATQLAFEDDGYPVRTITVTASHVDWQVEKPDAEWITVTPDKETGTISVSASPNPDKAVRNGSFRLMGEGAEDVTIGISQAAAVDFWDRSSAYRLGYRGKVKSVGKHIDLANNDGTIVLNDLQFDETGNLLQFGRDGGGMLVSVTYDEQNRPTTISAKSAEQDFSFTLIYGSHGKFIPIYEMFEYDLDEFLPVDFRVWMPFLIENLQEFKVRDKVEPENNLDYRFTVSDSGVSVDLYLESGMVYLLGYYTMNYEGIYPHLLQSEGIEYATYEIDAASGKIIRQTMASYYDIVLERSLDRRNTIRRAVYGVYDMLLAYNEQLDVVARTMATEDDMPSFEAAYEYDAQQNWTRITLTRSGQMPATDRREVTYWE